MRRCQYEPRLPGLYETSNFGLDRLRTRTFQRACNQILEGVTASAPPTANNNAGVARACGDEGPGACGAAD